MKIDWTQVIVAALAYGAGLIHQWMRVRKDVIAGRSMRPGPNKAKTSEKE